MGSLTAQVAIYNVVAYLTPAEEVRWRRSQPLETVGSGGGGGKRIDNQQQIEANLPTERLTTQPVHVLKNETMPELRHRVTWSTYDRYLTTTFFLFFKNLRPFVCVLIELSLIIHETSVQQLVDYHIFNRDVDSFAVKEGR